MASYSELKKKLLIAFKILDKNKILDELGHFSVRIPGEDKVLMNGKISPGQATEEDIVLLDLDGNKLEGKLEPAKEIPLHLVVYKRRSDILAAVHTHSPTIVALSSAGVPLRAMDNLGATAFGIEAPVFEELGLVDNFTMGHRIMDVMGSSNIVVLKGHGNLVISESIEETCISAIWAEKAASLQAQAMLLGGPKWFTKAEVDKVRKQVKDGNAFKRAWGYYNWQYFAESQ